MASRAGSCPRGSRSIEQLVCRGISVLILYKLRSQASTEVGGHKGGTASNGRNKTDFPGSMVSHSLHTANLCYVVWESTQLAHIVSHLFVEYSDKASFSLWTKLHWSHVIRNLLSMYGFQDHQLRNFKALFLIHFGHGCARKTLNQRPRIQDTLSPRFNDCLFATFEHILSLQATSLQMGYDTIN